MPYVGFFLETIKRKSLTGDTVIIYGAGRGGELLLREIVNNKLLKYNPIGFIDDNPVKVGKKLQGYSVLGTIDDISALRVKYPIKGILISFNNNKNNEKFEYLIKFCQKNEIFLKQFIITLDDIDPTI